MENKNQSIAICCIGKNENKYIVEFVEYYAKLGVDKIFLYDNNDIDGELFEDALAKCPFKNIVEIINYRGKKCCQLEAYNDCYKKHQQEYDWIAFFDIDEYFISDNKFNSIKDFIAQDIFENFDVILLHWLSYGDNNWIYYDERPLNERFSTPLPIDIVMAGADKGGSGAPENCYVKSIVRGKKDNLKTYDIFGEHSTLHSPQTTNNINGFRYTNCLGKKAPDWGEQPIWNGFGYIDTNYFTNGCLKHFSTKTAQEYAWKLKRGFPDFILSEERAKELVWTRFFRANKFTNEKLDVINKILKEDK